MRMFVWLGCFLLALGIPLFSWAGEMVSDTPDPGLKYFQQGHFERAVAYWEKELRELRNLPEPSRERLERYVNVTLRLAAAYQSLGRLEKAHQSLQREDSNCPQGEYSSWCLQEVLKILESGENTEFAKLAEVKRLMQLSDVYLAMRDITENDSCSLQQAEVVSSPFEEGKRFSQDTSIEESISLLEKAAKILREVENEKGIHKFLLASLYHRSGNIYTLLVERGNYDLESVKKSIWSLFPQLPSKDQPLNNIISLYEEHSDKLLDDETVKQQMSSIDVEILKIKNLLNIQYARFLSPEFDGSLAEFITEETSSKEIYSRIQKLPVSYDQASLFLTLAHIMLEFILAADEVIPALKETMQPLMINKQEQLHSDSRRNVGELMPYLLLKKAEEIGLKLGNNRLVVYAKFYQAQLFENAKQYKEAISLTRQAIFLSETYPIAFKGEVQKTLWGYLDLSFELEWQLARLLAQQPENYSQNPDSKNRCQLSFVQEGNLKYLEGEKFNSSAGCAYERANQYLKLVRQHLGGLSKKFREHNGRFYEDWVGFLLKEAKKVKEGMGNRENGDEAYLKKAIEVIEESQTDKIRNYFQDDCITESGEAGSKLEDLPKEVAVLYLRLLDKVRVELLLVLNGEIHHETKLVPQKDDLKTVQEGLLTNFGQRINDETSSRQLHEYLIEPIIDKLRKSKPTLLIIIPDGKLDNVPFSALKDKDQDKYVIDEEFSVAITLSLKSTDLSTISSKMEKEEHILLGGSSFKESKKTDVPPLQHFNQEIDSVQERFQETSSQITLLKEDKFTNPNIEHSLTNTPTISMIHFSTHGESEPHDFYLLTHPDKRNSLKEIADIFKARTCSRENQSIKLLTLSACQSSVTSSSMPLGLTGLALKTKVSTIIGTLWKVNEESTAKLVEHFYGELLGGCGGRGCDKPTALRNAQRILRKDKKGPSLWGGVISVGN